MDSTKRFYFRFSSKDTALDKLGFERCWEMAKAWGCEEKYIYWDFDSGANNQREKYQQLIRDIKSGVVTDVGTPNQIRLNRDSVESQIFGRLLRKHSVTLHLLESRGKLDLDTSEARRQYGLDGLFAEWEYEKIQERQLRSWQDIRNKRYSVNTPFGWVTDSDRKPIPDSTPTVCLLSTKEKISYAEILLEAIELTLSIGSLKQVAKTLNLKYGVYRFNMENLIDGRKAKLKKLNPHENNPHKGRKPLFFCQSTLKNILRNPILVGTLVYLKDTDREEIILNNHEALISWEKFQQLDNVISGKTNPYLAKTSKAYYPLSGVIYCGHCGGSCYSNKAGKRNGKARNYYYFRCKNIGNGCIAKPIRFEILESEVIRKLTGKYRQITNFAADYDSDKSAKDPKLIELNQQLQALICLPFSDKHIQRSIADTKTQIDNYHALNQQNIQASVQKLAILESVFSNSLYWETLKTSEKREIYHLLVKRVVIKVDIEDRKDKKFKERKSYVERIDLLV